MKLPVVGRGGVRISLAGILEVRLDGDIVISVYDPNDVRY